MAIEPRVLLFDEPLSNLDAKLRVSLRTEIRRIQQQLGITSIYVTHDQSEAMALSDLVVVMNAGRVEQAGSPDEVYRRPTTRFVADFIGRANFLEGPVTAIEGSAAVIELLGLRLPIPAADGVRPAARATVVIRPESIRVGTGELRARVRRATFLGPMAEYELEVGDTVLLAVDPDWMAHGLHGPGDEVAWSLQRGAGLRPAAGRRRRGARADRSRGGRAHRYLGPEPEGAPLGDINAGGYLLQPKCGVAEGRFGWTWVGKTGLSTHGLWRDPPVGSERATGCRLKSRDSVPSPG